MIPKLCLLIFMVALSCKAQQYSLSMDVNIPNGKPLQISLPWYPGLTLVEAMIQSVTVTNQNFTFVITYESAQYGGFVTTICGVASSASSFWEYTINGQQAQVGVSQYVTSIGDHITWAYTKV